MHKRSELFLYFELPQDFAWLPADIISFIESTKITEIFELVEAPVEASEDEEIDTNAPRQ